MNVVLARKYRPLFFRDVVGQDVFVRVLRNALAHNKVSHGIILTGIRGIGKTTLARLIAKALTCAHRQVDQEPCGICHSCQAIVSDSHLDVTEMDAASHTGVDDIRAILDSCQYSPVMGPYKIFIIDEVHMLSKSAFNALLKTLEEPPAHVKFILATTEIQKVPATVLSRCQQLALRRFLPQIMAEHLKDICSKEGFDIEEKALDSLICYSQGSARDALTMLERAIILAHDAKKVCAHDVQTLLGLPAEQDMHILLTLLLEQKAPEALELARSFYQNGMEPSMLLGELGRLIHGKIIERTIKNKPCDILDRFFQISQKGLTEIDHAPFPWLAMEIVIIRLAYMGRFPTPSMILSSIEKAGVEEKKSFTPSLSVPSDITAESDYNQPHQPSITLKSPESIKKNPDTKRDDLTASGDQSFMGKLVQALEKKREGLLLAHVKQDVSFVSFEDGRLRVCWVGPEGVVPSSFAQAFEHFLKSWIGASMRVVWQDTPGGLTLGQMEKKEKAHLYQQAKEHPLMKKIEGTFPGAILEDVAKL